MSESRGCRGLWRRRPEGWGQTHRQRLAVSFSLSFGALLLVCLYLTLTTGGGLFLLPGVLWLTVNGVLPNGTKHDKISC